MSAPRWLDKAPDYAIALSIAGWSVGALFALGEGGAPPWPARGALAAVHAVAAWLFATRAVARETAPLRSLALAMPSLLASGLAFRFGAARLEGASLAVFVAGASATCASLLSLGTSFAIFPARRELVDRGPYRVVRHPAYAAELAMVLATIAAGASEPMASVFGVPRIAIALVLAALAIAAIAVRAREEERFLASDPAYARYAERVRYRLVPYVW